MEPIQYVMRDCVIIDDEGNLTPIEDHIVYTDGTIIFPGRN